MADVVSFPAPNINQGKHGQWRDTNYPGVRAQATATPASISTRQSPWIGHEREWDLRAMAEEKKCCINRRLWQLLATAQLNYGRHSDLWQTVVVERLSLLFEPYGITVKASSPPLADLNKAPKSCIEALKGDMWIKKQMCKQVFNNSPALAYHIVLQ